MAVTKVQELLGLMQENLKCSICLELLKNPVATKCDHYFCRFCIVEFLATKRHVPCPLCKQAITKRSLQEKLELDKVVEGVNRLIAAFQGDTGTIFSPPKGPQSFFPCTPEPIKAKPSSKVNTNVKRNTRKAGRPRNSVDPDGNQETAAPDSGLFALPSGKTVGRAKGEPDLSPGTLSVSVCRQTSLQIKQTSLSHTSSMMTSNTKNILQYLEEGSCGFFRADSSGVLNPGAASGISKETLQIPGFDTNDTKTRSSVQTLSSCVYDRDSPIPESARKKESNALKSATCVDVENVINGMRSPQKIHQNWSRAGLAERLSNVFQRPTIRRYSKRLSGKGSESHRMDEEGKRPVETPCKIVCSNKDSIPVSEQLKDMDRAVVNTKGRGKGISVSDPAEDSADAQPHTDARKEITSTPPVRKKHIFRRTSDDAGQRQEHSPPVSDPYQFVVGNTPRAKGKRGGRSSSKDKKEKMTTKDIKKRVTIFESGNTKINVSYMHEDQMADGIGNIPDQHGNISDGEQLLIDRCSSTSPTAKDMLMNLHHEEIYIMPAPTSVSTKRSRSRQKKNDQNVSGSDSVNSLEASSRKTRSKQKPGDVPCKEKRDEQTRELASWIKEAEDHDLLFNTQEAQASFDHLQKSNTKTVETSIRCLDDENGEEEGLALFDADYDSSDDGCVLVGPCTEKNSTRKTVGLLDKESVIKDIKSVNSKAINCQSGADVNSLNKKVIDNQLCSDAENNKQQLRDLPHSPSVVVQQSCMETSFTLQRQEMAMRTSELALPSINDSPVTKEDVTTPSNMHSPSQSVVAPSTQRKCLFILPFRLKAKIFHELQTAETTSNLPLSDLQSPNTVMGKSFVENAESPFSPKLTASPQLIKKKHSLPSVTRKQNMYLFPENLAEKLTCSEVGLDGLTKQTDDLPCLKRAVIETPESQILSEPQMFASRKTNDLITVSKNLSQMSTQADSLICQINPEPSWNKTPDELELGTRDANGTALEVATVNRDRPGIDHPAKEAEMMLPVEERFRGHPIPDNESCGSSSADDLDIVPAEDQYEKPDLSLQPEEVLQRLCTQKHFESLCQNENVPASNPVAVDTCTVPDSMPYLATPPTSSLKSPVTIETVVVEPSMNMPYLHAEVFVDKNQPPMDYYADFVKDSTVTHISESLGELRTGSTTQTPSERGLNALSSDNSAEDAMIAEPITVKKIGIDLSWTPPGSDSKKADKISSNSYIGLSSEYSETQSQSILHPLPVVRGPYTRPEGEVPTEAPEREISKQFNMKETEEQIRISTSCQKELAAQLEYNKRDSLSEGNTENTNEIEKSESLQCTTLIDGEGSKSVSNKHVLGSVNEQRCDDNLIEGNGNDIHLKDQEKEPNFLASESRNPVVLACETQQLENSEPIIPFLSPPVVVDSLLEEEKAVDTHASCDTLLPFLTALSCVESCQDNRRHVAEKHVEVQKVGDVHAVIKSFADRSQGSLFTSRKRKLEDDVESENSAAAQPILTPEQGPLASSLLRQTANSAPARTVSAAFSRHINDDSDDSDGIIAVRRTRRKCFSLCGSPLKLKTLDTPLVTKRRRYFKPKCDEQDDIARVRRVKADSGKRSNDDRETVSKVVHEESSLLLFNQSQEDKVSTDNMSRPSETGVEKTIEIKTPDASPVGQRKKTVRGLAQHSPASSQLYTAELHSNPELSLVVNRETDNAVVFKQRILQLASDQHEANVHSGNTGEKQNCNLHVYLSHIKEPMEMEFDDCTDSELRQELELKMSSHLQKNQNMTGKHDMLLEDDNDVDTIIPPSHTEVGKPKSTQASIQLCTEEGTIPPSNFYLTEKEKDRANLCNSENDVETNQSKKSQADKANVKTGDSYDQRFSRTDVENDAADSRVYEECPRAFLEDLPELRQTPITSDNKCAEENEDNEDEVVRVRKKKSRLAVIESDSEFDSDCTHKTDRDSEASFQLNFTSSSAVSTQSDVPTTQERNRMESELERLQREIAEVEARLQQAGRLALAKSGSIANPDESSLMTNFSRQISYVKGPEQSQQQQRHNSGSNSEEEAYISGRESRRKSKRLQAKQDSQARQMSRLSKRNKHREQFLSDDTEDSIEEGPSKQCSQQRLMDDYVCMFQEDDKINGNCHKSLLSSPLKSSGKIANVQDEEDSSSDDLFLSPLSPSPPPPLKHSLARKEFCAVPRPLFDSDLSPFSSASSSMHRVRQSLNFSVSQTWEARKYGNSQPGKGVENDGRREKADIDGHQPCTYESVRQIPESQFPATGSSEHTSDSVRDVAAIDQMKFPLGLKSHRKGLDNPGCDPLDKTRMIFPDNLAAEDPLSCCLPDEEASSSSGSLPSLSSLTHLPPTVDAVGAKGREAQPKFHAIRVIKKPCKPEKEANKDPNLDTVYPGYAGGENEISCTGIDNAVGAVSNIEDEISQTELPRWKKSTFGFIASGLDAQKMAELCRLTEICDCKVYSKFNKSVTHVIVRTIPGKRTCERTLKYFQGIAGRCWVLSYDWIPDSLLERRLLPEAEYEIEGDTVKGANHLGPRLSRQSDVPLFKGFAFVPIGVSPDMSKKELSQMLLMTGGIVLEDLWDLASYQGASYKLVLRCVDSDTQPATPTEVELYNGHYKHMGLVTVAREWILDSVCTCRLQPLKEYVLNTCKDLQLPHL